MSESWLGKLFLILATGVLLSGCLRFQPSDLDYHEVVSADMPKPLEYAVYTPPGWHEAERLPLILFLHGGGDNHASFEKFGAHEYFDEQITLGNMPRVILVSPNGGVGFWENWQDGSYHYRDWILQQVVPDVQSRYHTLQCPQHCHLMGISMGGFGAMRFAYYNPNYFSSISIISGAIFTEEQDRNARNLWWLNLLMPFDRIFGPGDFNAEYYRSNPYFAWVQEPELAEIRLQLMWGDKDNANTLKGNRSFSDKLKQDNVEHEVVIFTGRHKWKSWLPNLAASVNFLTGKK